MVLISTREEKHLSKEVLVRGLPWTTLDVEGTTWVANCKTRNLCALVDLDVLKWFDEEGPRNKEEGPRNKEEGPRNKEEGPQNHVD